MTPLQFATIMIRIVGFNLILWGILEVSYNSRYFFDLQYTGQERYERFYKVSAYWYLFRLIFDFAGGLVLCLHGEWFAKIFIKDLPAPGPGKPDA